MSQKSRNRSHFPVQTSWPHAGNDLSRLSHRARRTLSSLIGCQRLPSSVSGLSMLIRRPHSAGITSIPEFGPSIESP